MRLHAVVADLESATLAVAGGATVIQLRLKDVSTAERMARGSGFRRLPATLIINDDVEAAILLQADGVHLGRDDPGTARALAHGLIVGRSANSPGEARAAEREGATYVGAGPVWNTPSKGDTGPPIGLDGLGRICAATSLPTVAIGGVDYDNVVACLLAGARGVAVVRAALRADLITAEITRFEEHRSAHPRDVPASTRPFPARRRGRGGPSN